MPVIGLDLGATKLASALLDAGAILDRRQADLVGRGGDAVGALILDALDAHLDHARRAALPVEAVGVAVPGIARQAEGTVWAPNIPGWDDFPLRDLVAPRVPGLPVAVDSDRAASILAESALGAARGARHAIFLAVGTGIGAGILIDGRVLRGAHDIAGAIGWMALDRPYRPDYDRCGCFETHASGAGIEHAAREIRLSHPEHSGPLAALPAEAITTRDVFDAAEAGDALAARVIDTAIECWGMAIANLVSLFNPEVVVLGGGVFGPAGRYLDLITAEARKWAQPVSIQRVDLRLSALGPDACLLGAARLALQAARPEDADA
jgi:glucokinase